MTRGPLPAGVYWRRRLLLLAVAAVLVLGLARVLGGSSDGVSADAGVAEQAAAVPPSTTPSQTTSPTASPTAKPGKRNRPSATPTTPAPPPPAVPDGPCDETDLAITPAAVDAVAGRDVVILLELRTIVDPACTWRISSGNLSVKLTSGAEDIWSSQECPAAVPVKDLVVRSAEPTTVALVWNAKRSDEDCSRLTDWALPGDYHVVAAALGGEPTDVQFTLEAPVGDIVTETAAPSQEPSPSGRPSRKPRPGTAPDAQPSGAVEPDGR